MSVIEIVTMVVIIVLVFGMALACVWTNVIASGLYFVINIGILYSLDAIGQALSMELYQLMSNALSNVPSLVLLAAGLANAVSCFIILLLFLVINLVVLLVYFAILKKWIRPIGLKHTAYRIFDKSFSVIFGFGTGSIFALVAVFALNPIAESQPNYDAYIKNTAVQAVLKYESLFPGLGAEQTFSLSIREFVAILNDPTSVFNEEFLKNLLNNNDPLIQDAIKSYIENNKDVLLNSDNQKKIMSIPMQERMQIFKDFQKKYSNQNQLLDDLKDILGLSSAVNFNFVASFHSNVYKDNYFLPPISHQYI